MVLFYFAPVVFLFCMFLYFTGTEYRRKSYYASQGAVYLGNKFYHLIYNTWKGMNFLQYSQTQYDRLKRNKLKWAITNDFGEEGVTIIDPELIKSVLIKDFNNFTDRRVLFRVPKNDYLFSKMLTVLKGEKWRRLRSTISPKFSPGNLKRLVPLFDASGRGWVEFINSELEKSSELDLVPSYAKYTLDIIASVVCGLDGQVYEKNEQSTFENMCYRLQGVVVATSKIRGMFKVVKFLLMIFFPKLSDLLGLSMFDIEVQDYFSQAIEGEIRNRRECKNQGNDFLQLMLDAREEDGEGNTLDDVAVVANCVLFIFAGFDTTQSLLIFSAYALALNEDVQTRLREEVEEILERNGRRLDYEAINEMSYLDMFISETLRLYPPSGVTDRACTENYKMPESGFVIKKGKGGVTIPIMALHYDPDYFPNPSVFDPMRFSPANKHKIISGSYIPFGLGPRNCLGMRFALAEVKVVIVHLVRAFRIQPSSKTPIPVEFTGSGFLKPKGGMHLCLTKIKCTLSKKI